MLDEVEWLREQLPHWPICLILYQYRTHDTAAFQAKAEHLGPSLVWIPKGATGIYQSLDRRVFGALRSKGRVKWRSYYFEYNSRCDTQTAAALLIASWNELSDSVIAAAWNFDETPAELDSDDSSDDEEFELDLNSDSLEWDEGYSDQGSEDGPQVTTRQLHIDLILQKMIRFPFRTTHRALILAVKMPSALRASAL